MEMYKFYLLDFFIFLLPSQEKVSLESIYVSPDFTGDVFSIGYKISMRAILPYFLLLQQVTSKIAGLPALTPIWPVTYVANESSYLYWCNWTGPVNTKPIENWTIVSLDWSDQKWGPTGWASSQPMDCEERLYSDAVNIVSQSKARHPKAWVYRNSCKALPWYASVRKLLNDPNYNPWFLRYAATPPINGTAYYSPKCDPLNNKCSDLYHDSTLSPDYSRMPMCPITGDCSVQVPGYPSGDGNCSSPACDVGPTLPVGEYVFDPRSWNVSIGGRTLGQWWLEEYLFSPTGAGNPNITGFYFDDSIDASGLCSELDSHQLADLGYSDGEGAQIASAYKSNFAFIYAELVRRGAYTEQQFTTVGPPGNMAQCNKLMRDSLCNSDSPTLTLLVRINDDNPLVSFATYLLGRGDYGFFGHTWQGCGSPDVNQPTRYPSWHADLYDADYGVPLAATCHETSPGSGVFERPWSKSFVSIDCSTLAVNITMLP